MNTGSSGQQVALSVHPTSTVAAVNKTLGVDNFEFANPNYGSLNREHHTKTVESIGIRDEASISVQSIGSPVQPIVAARMLLPSLNDELLARCVAHTPKQGDYLLQIGAALLRVPLLHKTLGHFPCT